MTPFCLTLLAVACGGDRSRSPTCGLALLVGPQLIQQQLQILPYVLSDVPRGLPATLPARVAGNATQATATVEGAKRALTLTYQGTDFPAGAISDSTGYALLVVDDSTQRVEGVLIYLSRRPPSSYPQLGSLSTAGGPGPAAPLYGVRLDWASVSNPRCPLLGTASPPPDAKP